MTSETQQHYTVTIRGARDKRNVFPALDHIVDMQFNATARTITIKTWLAGNPTAETAVRVGTHQYHVRATYASDCGGWSVVEWKLIDFGPPRPYAVPRSHREAFDYAFRALIRKVAS